ncbi:MAG: hypothetical protein KDK70_39655, partial [Myxococcales bacterium]|nr:hypothetical protein [Myxococcales bacterium]
PRRFMEATVVLNHGILAGELFGFDTDKVIETVDSVELLPEGIPQVFLLEEMQELRSFLQDVATTLDQALDAEGHLQGALGATLAAAPYVGHDELGLPYFRSHRFILADLHEALVILIRFLGFGIEHGLLAQLD